MGDGVTNDTTAFANAIAIASASASAVRVPKGIYRANLSIRKNNFALVGEGSAVTTIKTPDGVESNVLELGDTANGNSSPNYSHLTVRGFTLDGNSANVLNNAVDIAGWAMPYTYITYSFFDDIAAVNCWSGGVGIFINSITIRATSSCRNAATELTVANPALISIPPATMCSLSFPKTATTARGCWIIAGGT